MIKPATPLNQIPKRTPSGIRATVESVFCDRELIPLSKFTRKSGLSRDLVLAFIADGLLDAYQYSPGKYRKIYISKTSFIRLLKATNLRLK